MIFAVKKHYKILALILVVYAMLVGYAATSFTQASGVFWHRFEILTLVFAFISMHCILDIHAMYEWIYKYRVWITAGFIIFAVINNYSGSSITMYDYDIQPSFKAQYHSPIFGDVRGLRSDEWLVNVSRMMAGWFCNYGPTNNIVRGVTASGISATGGLFLDYSLLRSPSSWGYYLFGPEYGTSYFWSFQMFTGFLLSFELCMILTKKNRLYSLFGAVLIWFSTFNMWWSISTLFLSSIAIVVFFYYTVVSKNWKYRLLFGSLLALSGADFVTFLYPAWQVPLGWIDLAVIVWILIDNKQWKKYQWMDWLAIGIAFVFMVSIILRFFVVDKEYLNAITQTLYPGKRADNGGFMLKDLFGYGTASLMALDTFGNASETGTFFAAFPLGFILTFFALKKQQWKNPLLWCLLVPSVLLLVYCTVPLPSFLAKMTMMSNSTPKRAVQILGYACALLLIVSLAELQKHEKIKQWQVLLVDVICVLPMVLLNAKIYTRTFGIELCAVALVEFIVIYILLAEKKDKIVRGTMIISTAALLGVGASINPIMVGLSAITDKPIYTKVREIVTSSSESTLWIGAGNNVIPNYLIECGAPTLNSVNYIPNKDLWKVLDPDDAHEDIWNRYAHINILLSDTDETTYELKQVDLIDVHLSANDLIKLNVDYVASSMSAPDSYKNVLKEIYNEDGYMIYQVMKQIKSGMIQ